MYLLYAVRDILKELPEVYETLCRVVWAADVVEPVALWHPVPSGTGGLTLCSGEDLVGNELMSPRPDKDSGRHKLNERHVEGA